VSLALHKKPPDGINTLGGFILLKESLPITLSSGNLDRGFNNYRSFWILLSDYLFKAIVNVKKIALNATM
jgi:hypothetical protein